MFLYIIFSFYFPFTLQLQADIITLVFFLFLFFCNNISTVKTEKLSNKRKTLKFREDYFFTDHDYEKSQR